jgi:serine/threonine-protein kinase RsbT
VIRRFEMPIANEDDIVLVRRQAHALAEEKGFDPFARAAIVTATSELARNVWRHGGGGRAILLEIENAGRVGVQLELIDEGPGIVDVERVLRGGYSSAGSLGLGVAGSKRLADEFTLVSAPGQGTHATFIKWKRR